MGSNGSLDARQPVPGAKPHTSTDNFDQTLQGMLAQVAQGDFSARMRTGWTGIAGKVADRLNDIIVANQSPETELARVCRTVRSLLDVRAAS